MPGLACSKSRQLGDAGFGCIVLGQLGRAAEAREWLEKAISFSPAAFKMYVHNRVPWFRPEDHAHLVEGLRKAGWEG